MRTGITKWRTISQKDLEARVKSLPLGNNEPFQGTGITGTYPADEVNRRIIAATEKPAHPTQEEAEVELQNLLAKEQLKEAKELANG